MLVNKVHYRFKKINSTKTLRYTFKGKRLVEIVQITGKPGNKKRKLLMHNTFHQRKSHPTIWQPEIKKETQQIIKTTE